MTPEERLSALGLVSNITRVEAVGTWQKAAVAGKMSGDMYWQFGMATGLSTGPSTNVRTQPYTYCARSACS